MKKRLVFLALILAIILSVGACTSNAKQEFTSETGKFSVTVPTEPKEETESVDTRLGKIDIHMFTTEDGNTAYMIGYSDYPEDIIKQNDPQKLLDGGRDGAVSNVNGKLDSELKIDLDGNPGRALVISAKAGNDQDATIKARIYLVGNRLYQVMMVAPKGEVSSSEMDEFLKSFKLLKK